MTQPQQSRSLFVFLSVVALAGLVAPSPARATQEPPAVTPCEAKSFKFDKVKAACTEGGRSAAKKLMKSVDKKAKAGAESAGNKIEQGIQNARGVVGHRLIMEVDDDLVNPVKAHLRLLLEIPKATAQAAATSIDTYSEQLNAVEWKEAKRSETALKRKLEKLSRRSD